MKNKFIYSIFLGALFMTTVSCGDDFLEKEPTQFLTSDQLEDEGELNPDLLAGTVSGIYTMMINTGTGGTNLSHVDFGQKAYDIMSDMLCGDMALTTNNYGWYGRIAELQSTQNFANTDNYMPWRYYYRVVRSANQVIASLGGNDAIPVDDENKALLGQAKALRAYGYFYLTQLFAREYDPAVEILPIYTSPEQTALPKSSTADVYTLIEKDLTDAISLLENFTRTQKNQINQYVAKGLLAYTYGAMGRDGEAKVLAEDVVANGGFALTTPGQLRAGANGAPLTDGGFNNLATPSWMWGFDLTLDQGLDLVSWWGQMDLFTYSYAWAGDQKAIDRGLYDMIPVDDIRKGQFTTSANFPLMPINKFYHVDRIQGGQREVTSDYIYMRIEEMYLLSAETAAKSGDEPTAKTRLKEVMALRVPSTTYIDALTGQALKDEIYKQTRIEFWGEGKSYLAMKRNKATVKRGSNHLFLAGQQFQYNDPKLMFSIPQAEIQNNPFITGQN